MKGSSISGTVTHTVDLGSGHYRSPLTITATGDIAPTAYGANGIYVPTTVHHGSIDNMGTIASGYGGMNAGAGGIGVDLATAASVTNSGHIYGGDGGYSYRSEGGSGGSGVQLNAGGQVANTGIHHRWGWRQLRLCGHWRHGRCRR